MRTASLWVVLLSCTGADTGDSDPERSDEPTRNASAVVQLFDWPYAQVTPVLCDLRRDGVSHVHISPATQSNGGPWWGRYQPLDLRVIEGPLGDEDEFVAMTREADRCGIEIVADVVLNHAANMGWNEADLYYPPGCDRTLPASTAEGSACLWKPEHFNEEECVVDWGNHCAVLYGRICGGGSDRGLPDLATGHCGGNSSVDPAQRNYHPHVLAVAVAYLEKLADLGVHSVRFDAAKHMHPAFLADLWAAVGSRFSWAYGEIIAADARDGSFSAYRDVDLDWMDFPLAARMKGAFGFGGDLRSLSASDPAMLAPSNSVAFVTQHDIWGNESGLGYRWDDFTDEWLAHVFILGRADGIPYLYTELPGRSQSERYRPAGSNYIRFEARAEVRAMLRFHADQLGTAMTWITSTPNALAFTRGSKAAVFINKAGDWWDVGSLTVNVADGDYVDVLSGRTATIRSNRLNWSLPPRSALMLQRR